VNFSERPSSTDWAALNYKGQTIAEVWFKPEGNPHGLTFRLPRKTFQIPEMARLLTVENLLKTVGIARAEVESWEQEGQSHSDSADLARPLTQPEEEIPHLEIHVRLKAPVQEIAAQESDESTIPAATWQKLEARWYAILNFESTMDSMRISMEGLRAEMEAASTKMLNTEEKLHASNADVLQWNQAKSRVIFSLPKARDYIHRSIWAKGVPERKELEDLFKRDADRSQISAAQLEKVQRQLEGLLKDRQVLSGQGTTVYNECKRILSEVQGTLRTLQSNAATNALNKRMREKTKGKYF
jgi:hypothetical protein